MGTRFYPIYFAATGYRRGTCVGVTGLVAPGALVEIDLMVRRGMDATSRALQKNHQDTLSFSGAAQRPSRNT